MERVRGVLFAGMLVFSAGAASSPGELEILNIRVGQGDSTLILGPPVNGERVSVLVDAGDIGGRDGGNILRAVLSKNGVSKLDYVIVTHYDADHIGGLVSGGAHGISFLLGWNKVPGNLGDDDQDGVIDWIGQKYWKPDPEEMGTGDDVPVRYFVDRGDQAPNTSQAYAKYRNIVNAYGTRLSLENQSDVDGFQIDLGAGATMKALAANGYVRGRGQRVTRVNTENERSLSFLVSYGKFDYLISGDLIGQIYGRENAAVEKAVGRYIESQGITVDVLHVNHHGANNASEAVFLDLIKPTIAIISAGNGNDHKHPSIFALSRLADAGVYRIVQTSWGTTKSMMPENIRSIQAIYQGDVRIETSGDKYTISTSRTFDSDSNPLRP